MQSCLWCVEGVGTDNAQLTRYIHDIYIEVAGEYEYWFYTGYANTETVILLLLLLLPGSSGGTHVICHVDLHVTIKK